MLENEPGAAGSGAEGTPENTNETRPRRRASRPAGPPPEPPVAPPAPVTPPASQVTAAPAGEAGPPAERGSAAEAPPVAEEKPKTRRTRRTTAKAAPVAEVAPVADEPAPAAAAAAERPVPEPVVPAATFQPPMVVFQPPQLVVETGGEEGSASRKGKGGDTAGRDKVEPAKSRQPAKAKQNAPAAEDTSVVDDHAEDEDEDDDERPGRRRRRRGGRGRGKGKDVENATEPEETHAAEKSEDHDHDGDSEESDDSDDDRGDGSSTRRRRRRRRRTGGGDGEDVTVDDPPNTVVHVREARSAASIAASDEVQSVKGSTRLEAKKQRRREGREQGRRRPPIITESEFLARRESVERVMVIRNEGERTQIAVLEDDLLVEHYVDRSSHQSYVGNVYLGKVQNVLPSMEAAFVDIGKGRNAVLYAGEVNWDLAGLDGQPRRIESALKSGQSVLVQVTKDPLGHKGARLTSQISLPGRYLVYVPDGSMTGISRKLPDKERTRLKQILKKVMPENAGVIVRTAAEGAAEEELAHDVSRLAAQWENIQRQSKTASAPALLYGEPDMTIRVVRDIFNEDFSKLVIQGEESWDTVQEYMGYVAPHLADRLQQWDADEDVFTAYRVDEQISKAMDRKVWLPSGGSLVIDRTEAMTVVDVNTGKYTGHGGNLEETVTRNNLEAAEEIVHQLRLRDIGGIIVIDFIDMVLENNRDLVLRRLLECLSRDRTKHQVAEVTSLGLVQMTRKRVGQGLIEAFSEPCECCNGRGIHVSLNPVDDRPEKAAVAGGRRKRKGSVEKAVEEKLARADHAAERVRARAAKAEIEDIADDAVETAVAVEDAAAAADEAPAGLEAVEPGLLEDAVLEPAGANGRRRRTRRPRAKADDRAEAGTVPSD